jgi:hypothetical protein
VPTAQPGSQPLTRQLGAVSQKEIDKQANVQALRQEQAVFERNIRQNDALFRLQMVMGWSTFVIGPATLITLIVYPPLGAAFVPLLGVAVWNWRRMLARGWVEPIVTTKRRNDRD